MDQRIVEAILSDAMLKTAEDAEAAGRIAARAYAQEWQRLEGLFKGAAHESGEGEDVEAEEGGDEGESPVSPEDLAWLVENLGV